MLLGEYPGMEATFPLGKRPNCNPQIILECSRLPARFMSLRSNTKSLNSHLKGSLF